MKIAIFGGTGGTGLQLIKQALQVGHHVKALLRTPSKLKIQDDNLEIIKGDVLNKEEVDNTVENTELILSALGVTGLGSTTLYSDSIANIISAAESKNITRIMCVTAAGVGVKSNRWKIFKNIYADMERMENALMNSTLNYTIMKPPGLTNSELTKTYRTEFGDFMQNSSQLSRADLAHCMLTHINDENYFKKKVALSY
jgi:putative NADH-flavin reductase